MNLLLDTHFLLWILLGSGRLAEFPWLDRYRPWGVSPISLLEIQFLSEVGHVEVRDPEFYDTLRADRRFVVDEAPLLGLVEKAVGLSWTRDPFDRLLAAHSLARRVPFCTLDRSVRQHHPWLPAELST
jgi:PIN domain nuclease of toxin-antitoxin system